jgi:hypothetical protein
MKGTMCLLVCISVLGAAGEVPWPKALPGIKTFGAARSSTTAPRQFAAPKPQTTERFVPGEVVVRFKKGLDPSAIDAFCQREKVSVLRKGRFIDYYRLKVPSGLAVTEATARYSSLPEVEFAEPNFVYTCDWYPNDPLYWSTQWDLQRARNLQRTGGLDLQLAWELTTGQPSVVVAVVDAGVAYENYPIPSYEQGQVYSPDGYYHIAPDLSSTRFVQGYDFVSDDSHPGECGDTGAVE